MLFLFAFFFGGFPLSDVVLNFNPVERDIAFILTKFVPLDRQAGRPSLHINANAKNNSKLLTSRDPGIREHINRA